MFGGYEGNNWHARAELRSRKDVPGWLCCLDTALWVSRLLFICIDTYIYTHTHIHIHTLTHINTLVYSFNYWNFFHVTLIHHSESVLLDLSDHLDNYSFPKDSIGFNLDELETNGLELLASGEIQIE